MKKLPGILFLIIVASAIALSGCSRAAVNETSKEVVSNTTTDESEEDDEAVSNAHAIGEVATNIKGEYKSNVTSIEVIWNGGEEIKNPKMENGEFTWNVFPGLKKGSKIIIQAYENDKVIDKDEIAVE